MQQGRTGVTVDSLHQWVPICGFNHLWTLSVHTVSPEAPCNYLPGAVGGLSWITLDQQTNPLASDLLLKTWK